VRSLVADLGTALGGGAHLRGLRRTRVGAFDLRDALDARQVGPGDVRPALGLLAGLERREVADEILEFVLHGRVLDAAAIDAEDTGPFVLVSGSDELVAVYERIGDSRVKPIIVYATTPGDDAPAQSAVTGE
jgi:tRNA pseudouridine55 synthase